MSKKTVRVGDVVKLVKRDAGGYPDEVKSLKHYTVTYVEPGRQMKSTICDGPLLGLEGIADLYFVWRFEKVRSKSAKKVKSTRRQS